MRLFIWLLCIISSPLFFSCSLQDIPKEIKQFESVLRHTVEEREANRKVELYNACYSSVKYVAETRKGSVNCNTVTVHVGKDGSCFYSTNMNRDKMNLVQFFAYADTFCKDTYENTTD